MWQGYTLFPIFRKSTQIKSITVIQLCVDSYLHKCTHMQVTLTEAVEAGRDWLSQKHTAQSKATGHCFPSLHPHTDNKRAFRQNEIGQQSQVIGKAIKMNEIYMQMREVILREEPQTMQCSLWEEGSVCRQLTVGIYGLPSA